MAIVCCKAYTAPHPQGCVPQVQNCIRHMSLTAMLYL